jgi:hypothetical protein
MFCTERLIELKIHFVEQDYPQIANRSGARFTSMQYIRLLLVHLLVGMIFVTTNNRAFRRTKETAPCESVYSLFYLRSCYSVLLR